jgi:hypothetical protein
LEWSKVKNIIILILLLVNGFLLFLVGWQQYQVRLYQRSALTQAAQVLELNGIQVSQAALDQAESGTSLTALSADRSVDSEAVLARALLGGDAACISQSGGVYTYTSPAGTAIFRSGGSFRADLVDGPDSRGDNAAHATQFLKELGLTSEVLSADSDGTVDLRQLLDGVPLYSCQLSLEYDEGRLVSIYGTVMAATPASSADSADTLDLPTALIRFMSAIRDSGDVCSSVTGLRPGYRSSQAFGSVVQLTPVWLVTTNVSDYYLDGTTGELIRQS